jgi:hypothetical protein
MVGEHGISIWFFIGISLLVNGALILGAGIWQLVHPPAVHVVLYDLHANVWWGALLLAVGIVYSLRFRPRHKTVN